jgi:hypothetical protein
MTTFYLRPIPLPSTQQVDDIAFVFKKGRVARSMLTTFDLWKGRGRGHDLWFRFFEKVPHSTSRSTMIGVDGLIFENDRPFSCIAQRLWLTQDPFHPSMTKSTCSWLRPQVPAAHILCIFCLPKICRPFHGEKEFSMRHTHYQIQSINQ